MRKIIHIPVAHTYEEMCAFKDIVGEKPARFQEREDEIAKYLNTVERELNKTRIHKIYVDTVHQDTEQKRKEHIDYYLNLGSKTHGVINRLMQKGGRLEKTEDTILVFEGIRWANDYIRGKISFDLVADLRNDNLKDRDEFISKRINETLKDGDCGALFIGAAHNVVLPENIEVKHFKLPEILLKNPYQRKS